MVTGSFLPLNGDLLFQQAGCGELCEAIEQVTTGYQGARLSHIGLVIEKKEEGLFVLEAIPEGVLMTSLFDFLNKSTDNSGNPKVMAGRLKPPFQQLIPAAIAEAEKFIGKPYNKYFLFGNGTYYCSQIIYLAFREANGGTDFFYTEPMTFKKPGSQFFFPVWTEYFEKLGVEIPEGKPGINPGLISRSEKIEMVHIYGRIEGLLSE